MRRVVREEDVADMITHPQCGGSCEVQRYDRMKAAAKEEYGNYMNDDSRNYSAATKGGVVCRITAR